MPTSLLRKSPLHDRHLEAGGRLVPFAGWEMPVRYEGIRQEHLAVREGVGVFDVSHMGEIETTGADAEAFLQRLLSNDVEAIADRGAQYAVLCREDGGVLDDLFTYRLGSGRFLTITNAANHGKDMDWFDRHAGGRRVDVLDASDGWAMLAVQGPRARALLAGICGGELPPRFRVAELTVAGVPCLVCGTGYTGEDGCEVLVSPERATAVWDAVLAAGATPCGLGARDTLRLEACFHLYGSDLSEDRDPIGAGLGWCCKPETGFIGSERLVDLEPRQVLAPFAFTDQGVPRQGNAIRTGHGDGLVTSGSFSPCLEVGIGLGYVPLAAAVPGTRIEVDVRGRARPAEVRTKPLYRKTT